MTLPHSQIREPLDAALQVEIRRLDALLNKVMQALGIVCVFGGVVVYFVLDLPMGVWLAGGALLYLGWFSLEARLRGRGAASEPLDVAAIAVVSTMPWAVMLVIGYTQGATYALGSWVPPLLCATLIVISTARLRPGVPLIIGVSGGVCLLLVYFAVLRGLLPAEARHKPLYVPFMQFTRAISLMVGGALAMVVTRGLRNAFGRADREVRRMDLFGKYFLERRIAAGGMGTVYEARYRPEGGFERRVAVKLIHPHLAQRSDFVAAFRREAELSALLAHPNIVQVFDFGPGQDSFFLAMEYVDGMTLGALMARFRSHAIDLSPALVSHVGREVLAGLACAHGGARDSDGAVLRVLHRDLCPANILLSRSGEVKISDFGVARALRDAESLETRTVVGHAAYMAPEQARAQPTDERGDLFSLGVVLWEMLCGRRLFHRGPDGPTLMALMNDEVPTPSSQLDVDPAWDHFLGVATQREPERRYASALAMSAALDQLADARGPEASTDALAKLVARALTLPSTTAGEEPVSDQAEALTVRHGSSG